LATSRKRPKSGPTHLQRRQSRDPGLLDWLRPEPDTPENFERAFVSDLPKNPDGCNYLRKRSYYPVEVIKVTVSGLLFLLVTTGVLHAQPPPEMLESRYLLDQETNIVYGLSGPVDNLGMLIDTLVASSEYVSCSDVYETTEDNAYALDCVFDHPRTFLEVQFQFNWRAFSNVTRVTMVEYSTGQVGAIYQWFTLLSMASP